MLNERFLKRKIKLIEEELIKLEPFKNKTFDEIAKQAASMAVIERYLERLITRALDINQHIIAERGDGSEKVRGYEDTFYALAKLGVYDDAFAQRLAPSAGLRNRLVHDYNNTDPKIIFSSVGDALRDYTRYCDAILKFIA